MLAVGSPKHELAFHYAAVRMRIEAPRVIQFKAKPRPFTISPQAKAALSSRFIYSTGPDACGHVCTFYAYKLNCFEQGHSSVRPPTVAAIIRAVCAASGSRSTDLISHRRTKDIIIPRQVAMYLAATMTHTSLPQIGRRMGGRDHTTILHGTKKIAHLLSEKNAEALDLIDAARKVLQPCDDTAVMQAAE